eukprot:gene22156-26295_t
MQFPTSNTETNALDGTGRRTLTTILKQQHRSKPLEILQAGSSFIDDGQFYSLYTHDSCLHSALYRCPVGGSKVFAAAIARPANWPDSWKPSCKRHTAEARLAFRHLVDFTAPPARNNCHTGFISAITSKGRLYVTEFDIGEFFIHGEAREVDGEFQAVIVMRAKAPLTTVTTHQVEKDRWFKTVDAANTAAKEAAKALKAAVDSGALTS